MPRLKGIKFIEESIDELTDNYAWTYFNPKETEKYRKTALRLSKKYPKETFWIIDYGRMSRGWFPNIGINYWGKQDNKEDDVQVHVSSFCVGVLSDDEEITWVDGKHTRKYITFYKNGEITFPKEVEELND